MPYQPINSLAALGQAGQVPLWLSNDALGAIDRGQQADESNLANLFAANQHEQVMNPLRERSLGLSNQTAEASLPGVVANSSILQRKDRNEGVFNDAHIQDILGKYKADEITRHVQSMSALGTTAQQAAALAVENPLLAHAQARQLFAKTGHADFWNPAWDNLTGGQLAMKLQEVGRDIQAAGEKFNQAITIQDRKAELAKSLEELKARHQLERQRELRSSVEQLHQAALSQKKALFAPDLQHMIGQMEYFANEADKAGDSAAAAEYRNKARIYTQGAGWLASQGAATGNQKALDTAELINNGKFTTVNPERTNSTPPSNDPKAAATPTKFTQAHEDWISRAMKANPGSTREQVIEQGIKLGKFQ